jgi:hypothetical protein
MSTSTETPPAAATTTGFKPKKSVALSGVPAGNTALCTVGRSGNDLHYSGYDIHDLADNCEFEEVAYLLIHGKLPNASELKGYKQKLQRLRGLPAAVLDDAMLTQVAALPDGDILANGLQIYAANCVACHGANGEGTTLAPPLASDELRARLSDAGISSPSRIDRVWSSMVAAEIHAQCVPFRAHCDTSIAAALDLPAPALPSTASVLGVGARTMASRNLAGTRARSVSLGSSVHRKRAGMASVHDSSARRARPAAI